MMPRFNQTVTKLPRLCVRVWMCSGWVRGGWEGELSIFVWHVFQHTHTHTLSLSLSLSLMHRTHTREHTHKHARARTHTHTHTRFLSLVSGTVARNDGIWVQRLHLPGDAASDSVSHGQRKPHGLRGKHPHPRAR